MPMEFVLLDEFHRKKLQPGEAVSIFVHNLKKLLDQSMPGLEEAVREKLHLHQFLAGLPENISKQLRATGEVIKLVARTGLLMTIDDREQSAAVSQKSSEVKVLCEQVALLKPRRFAAPSAAPTGVVTRLDNRTPSIDLGVSAVIVWGTYYASVLIVFKGERLGPASHAANLDISPETAIRETRTGRLQWAAGVSDISKPRRERGNCGDREKTAFCPGPGMGLYQFKWMPFGLSGAPSSFQRLMDTDLWGLPYVIYLDDILVHSATEKLHCQHLQMYLSV